MLEVRKVTDYLIPKYPKSSYFEYKGFRPGKLLKDGARSLMLLAAIEASSCGHDDGPLGGMQAPEPIDENTARTAIIKVFSDNGINLNQDVSYELTLENNSKVTIVLDGYKSDKKIGYEYINKDESPSFSNEIQNKLYSDTENSGPYIKSINTMYDYSLDTTDLENMIIEFINDLKSRGII